MEKKYQCKLWSRELTGSEHCVWVSGAMIKDGQVVITISTEQCFISQELAFAALEVFRSVPHNAEWSCEAGVCFSSDVNQKEV